MDAIEIRGLRVMTVVGVLPHERQQAQPVLVDLCLSLDLREAGASDSLSDTVDYAALSQAVAACARTSRDILLERLADRIATVVLGFAHVRSVEVALAKLRPALPEDLASTVVRIRRPAEAQLASATETYRAYVALGSNLGNRAALLRFAVQRLSPVVAQSAVYETQPVGGPPGQGPFFNMVLALDTPHEPLVLLRQLLAIEAEAGRERRLRHGPRLLDLDLLLHDAYRIEGPGIQVPHPRMHERRFVLQPLSEIAPERCPPGWDQRLPDEGIRRLGPLNEL